jgi:dCTP deaminase
LPEGETAMILPYEKIIEAHNEGAFTIEPFEKKQVQPASYDLRVGEQGATTSSRKIVNIKENGYLLLHPGDFGVIITHEAVKMGLWHVARIGLRSKYSRKGLIATTGPQIDPGFYGKLIIGISNPTPKPISIPYMDDILSIEIHNLVEECTKPYDGPYQGRMTLGPEDIEMVAEEAGPTFSEILKTLNSLSQNVATLSDQVTTIKWIFGIGFAVLLTLIVALLSILTANL